MEFFEMIWEGSQISVTYNTCFKKLFQCQVSEDNIVSVFEIDTLINVYDDTCMFVD